MPSIAPVGPCRVVDVGGALMASGGLVSCSVRCAPWRGLVASSGKRWVVGGSGKVAPVLSTRGVRVCSHGRRALVLGWSSQGRPPSRCRPTVVVPARAQRLTPSCPVLGGRTAGDLACRVRRVGGDPPESALRAPPSTIGGVCVRSGHGTDGQNGTTKVPYRPRLTHACPLC